MAVTVTKAGSTCRVDDPYQRLRDGEASRDGDAPQSAKFPSTPPSAGPGSRKKQWSESGWGRLSGCQRNGHYHQRGQYGASAQ
eukprot:1356964-Pyramimonas_sp.AAC.1